MKKFWQFLRFQFPPILWMLAIFIASSTPGNKVPTFVFGKDKFLHAGVFFVLCWLTHRALRFSNTILFQQKSLLFAMLLTILYGIFDEVHQVFVIGRSAGIDDVIADVAGGILYILLYSKFKFYEKTLEKE